ncbi:hypothetical protein Fcan01_02158 [Folsomia candida]|uniref:Uncharacterized protein n=1 Tax=Folsomia candida TaxID=158441 RepID=A0A226F2Q7_FOLCA|nr:hypothetical protein Fcan01_02158 [Folsomia candida]
MTHLDLDTANKLLKPNHCDMSLGDPSPFKDAEWLLEDLDKEEYTPDRVSTGHYIVYLRFGFPGYFYGGKNTPGSFNLRHHTTSVYRTFKGTKVSLDCDEWEIISKFATTSHEQCLKIQHTGLFVTLLLFSFNNSRTSQTQEKLWLLNNRSEMTHLDLDTANKLLKANNCHVSLCDPSTLRNAEWFQDVDKQEYTPDRVSTGHYIVYLRFGSPGYLYAGKNTVQHKLHPTCPYLRSRHHSSYKGLPVFVIQGSPDDIPEPKGRNSRVMALNESVLQSAIMTCELLRADISGFPVKRDFVDFQLSQNWNPEGFDRFKRQIETLSGRKVVISYNFQIDQLELVHLNCLAGIRQGFRLIY